MPAYAGVVARLPLFPLGTVLVPGGVLPLQIFEPRYVALLADLLVTEGRQDPPEFGVLAIREGHEVGTTSVRALHEVGCAARLTRVGDLGEGRYLVVCEGGRRFRLRGLIEDEDGAPYAVGDVAWLAELPGDQERVPQLGATVRRELRAFRARLGTGPQEGDDDVPHEPAALSYALVDLVDLDLGDRQRLLAAGDVEQRLRLALRMIRREAAIAAQLGAVVRPTDPRFNPN